MDKAVAIANNDVVFLAWSYDQKIEKCLGFGVVRLEAGGVRTVLPAWVGFESEENPDWHPKDTEVWPVQKFAWRDLTATWGHSYSYEVVPRVGEPGALESLEDRRLLSNEVTLTPACSTNVSAYFNRGILSTQALAHVLPKDDKGIPVGDGLLEQIQDAGDPIREALAGQIVEGLTLLLKGAERDDSRCLAALYELNDPELVQALGDPEHVSVVLSNAGETGDSDETNHDARLRLHDEKISVADRMMPDGHIGHDKFVVKLTADGSPSGVLTGSTNWTYTGLCAQANNAIMLADGPVAAAYRDFWNRLKEESHGAAEGSATQSDEFRTANHEPHRSKVDDADVTVWFSPNTKQHTKPKSPPAPSDLEEVAGLIKAARSGVFFLLFQPGSPSVLDPILEAQEARPELFVRGAATDPKAIRDFETTLFHRTGEVAQVAAAAALDHQLGSLQAELLKTPHAHAIIHDKIVVIDPLSSDCVVVTGSHNLGYKASYANDENLLIIRGHQPLARAYATHVLDIYDHYRWRWQSHRRHSNGAKSSFGLEPSDAWQSKYFSDPQVMAEREFWLA